MSTQKDTGPPYYIPWDPVEAHWSRIWAAKDRREAEAHRKRPRKIEPEEQADIDQARKEAWAESPTGYVVGEEEG